MVLPDAPVTHLILTDQWLSDTDFFLANVLAAEQTVAVAPAGRASERDRIKPRLFAMFANAGCLDVTMDNLAMAGVTTIP